MDTVTGNRAPVRDLRRTLRAVLGLAVDTRLRFVCRPKGRPTERVSLLPHYEHERHRTHRFPRWRNQDKPFRLSDPKHERFHLELGTPRHRRVEVDAKYPREFAKPRCNEDQPLERLALVSQFR